MATKNATAERQDKPIPAVVQEIGKGKFHEAASEALVDLTAAVVATDKAGTLTLVIKVEPSKGMDNLTVTGTWKLSLPTESQSSIFFADDDNNLVRDDPNQLAAPLREVAHRGETA